MELPNYSRQLMQQLQALRKEAQFCDCTILLGDTPHHAHKIVLAASSMLFRSLLDNSDSISIDTAVVSSQEFVCLLDMIYTGKLPVGKHNISRIITAADSLQMFDVAVGCKNILSSLMTEPTATVISNQANVINLESDKIPSPKKWANANLTIDPKSKGDREDTNSESVSKDTEFPAEPEQEMITRTEEPSCKKPRLEIPGSQENGEPEYQSTSSSGEESEDMEEEENTVTDTKADQSTSLLLEKSSELMEHLTKVPSILELLRQAAFTNLGEQEKDVVCECCEEADPGSAINRLMIRLKEGVLSERGLQTLLHTVKEKSPSSCSPSLLLLLEEVEKSEQPEAQQEVDGDDTSEQEKQPDSPNVIDHGTNGKEEQEGMEKENKDKKVEGEKESSGKGTEPGSASSTSFPYFCCWCKKGFAYKCRMLAHSKRCAMSQDLKHKCPLCPKMLSTLQALRHHRAEAHREPARGKKKVACDLCSRSFAHCSGLIYHKRTEHYEEKPFACEECGAKFGANSSLKNHMRLHTGEKPYQCKHCDMTFSVAAALAYHTKTKHSEGKMYACQYCEALFPQSIELTRHVRTHTGDRPYVCRECGKGYIQASGLTVHLQTSHNISTHYDCQKCCFSFSSLEEHRQHLQEFHPKEYHKCTICHKVYTSATLLEKHKIKHKGSKIFRCDLCHKSYQQLSGLWYHNRTKHPEILASQTNRQLKTLVQCDICFKFFPSTASLGKHQKTEHPDSEVSVVHYQSYTTPLSSKEEIQANINGQHFSKEGSAFCCTICSLVCPSLLQLQEHFQSSHSDVIKEHEETEKQASTSHTVRVHKAES